MASSPWASDKEDPLLPQHYTAQDLDVEDAEGAVLESIELRQRRENDEKLQQEDEERFYHMLHNNDEMPKPKKLSLKEVARQVQGMNAVVAELKRKNKASRHLEALREDDEPAGLVKDPLGHNPLDHRVLHERESSETDTVCSKSSRRSRESFFQGCHALISSRVLCRALHLSLILWLAIPLSIAAYVFYYHAGDPDLDFLPGEATLSWWLNFAARLCVTLELAFLTQWLLVDCLLLTTGCAGPLVTLTFLQAKGWPFVLATWSLLNLVWLQGDNRFQRHWLYWTNLDLYNSDVGDYILESTSYLRILLAGLVAGSLTAIKRTYVALNFNGRQMKDFKPRLEKILADVVIVSEIANLASQADGLNDSKAVSGRLNLRKTVSPTHHKRWPTVDFEAAVVMSDEDGRESSGSSEVRKHESDPGRAAFSETRSMNGTAHIKEFLDGWKEPVSKRDKSTGPSIGEILRFRRALSFLDDVYPFGQAFGRANTRDECITSSHQIFWQLVTLSSNQKREQSRLPFDVLELIAVEDDGTEGAAKKKAIRKLFRPDAANELTLLAFVQSCDNIYKRFRYFRASVRNASVINDVLEQITNAAFFVVLFLILLSVLEVDPWTLLFSMTSLLVSLSFALGSSVSKYVEGVLLIAIRKPFDLGDRIFMSSAGSLIPDPNVTSKSWFVEDINLTTTPLRYSRTNEVSTINNSDIAGLRIVNCNQSPLATVFLEMNLHISVFDNDNLKKFRSALDKYVSDRPRVWDSVSFCRHDDFDADNERVKFAVSVRHCSSWQDASRIKMDRADLVRFLYETSKELSIYYEEPPSQQVMYFGGALKEGEIEHGYRRELLSSKNIQTGSLPLDPLPADRLRDTETSQPLSEQSNLGASSR